MIEQLSCGSPSGVLLACATICRPRRWSSIRNRPETLRAGATAGALATLVSGSGPTCAFLAADAAAADRLAAELPKHAPRCAMCGGHMVR